MVGGGGKEGVKDGWLHHPAKKKMGLGEKGL